MHELEQHTFATWPALEEQDHAGWRLRFANGVTQRANSANALASAGPLTVAQVEYVEAFYRSRHLPPVFRLASFCTPQASDDLLAERGYRFVDLSLVMTRPIAGRALGSNLTLLANAALWLQAFLEVTQEQSTEQTSQLQILQAIRGGCAYAVVYVDGRPVGCGLGVLSGTHLALLSIATHREFRGQGLAHRLCTGLLDWGSAQGATTAFLQVVGANTRAVNLYERLGFRCRYHYWYRQAPAPIKHDARKSHVND